MKFNKVLEHLDLPPQVKRYVNNYINESIKLMHEQGSIEEFIWTDIYGAPDDTILELLENDIICFGNENESGILLPVSPTYDGVERNGIIVLKYMLSDKVLLQNGFKLPKIREENNV